MHTFLPPSRRRFSTNPGTSVKGPKSPASEEHRRRSVYIVIFSWFHLKNLYMVTIPNQGADKSI